MTIHFQPSQERAAAAAPMHLLSAHETLRIAGGGITTPEMLTTPPAGTETNQVVSPEL